MLNDNETCNVISIKHSQRERARERVTEGPYVHYGPRVLVSQARPVTMDRPYPTIYVYGICLEGEKKKTELNQHIMFIFISDEACKDMGTHTHRTLDRQTKIWQHLHKAMKDRVAVVCVCVCSMSW